MEYKAYLEQKLGRPLSGGKPDGWNPPKFKAENEATRRKSEVTPPSNFNTKFDSDLMDFNAPSPEKPKDPQSEAHSNFLQFVDQMYK